MQYMRFACGQRAYICQSGPDLPAPTRHGACLLHWPRSDGAQHVVFHVRVRRHILWQHSVMNSPEQLDHLANTKRPPDKVLHWTVSRV